MSNASNASEMVAKIIERRILGAMQEADEIGGPDWREYAAMMDRLAEECTRRATTARETHGRNAVLRTVQDWCRARAVGLDRATDYTAEIWDTGGGCTAIGVQPVNQAWHWLITDDASAPESEDCPVCVGLYTGAGDCWASFDCANLAGALRLMGSLVSHEFGE